MSEVSLMRCFGFKETVTKRAYVKLTDALCQDFPPAVVRRSGLSVFCLLLLMKTLNASGVKSACGKHDLQSHECTIAPPLSHHHHLVLCCSPLHLGLSFSVPGQLLLQHLKWCRQNFSGRLKSIDNRRVAIISRRR